jgi:hypothetical protein
MRDTEPGHFEEDERREDDDVKAESAVEKRR